VSSDPQPQHSNDPGAPHAGAPSPSYFGIFTQVLNIVGTVLILTMAVAVNADVIGRDAFNHPIAGVLEFIGLSIVAVVFLQMANTLREDRHVSNDVFIRMIAATYPRLASALHSAFHVIGALLMLMIVIYVWPIMAESYREGFYAGTANVIEIPIWPFQATSSSSTHGVTSNAPAAQRADLWATSPSELSACLPAWC
jgi:TRAP-type C4-dicarboxylate transport system permease small subunit